MSGIHMKKKCKLKIVNWKEKNVLIDHLNHASLFLKYSRYVDSTFNNIDEYNLNQNLKTLTLFAEILSNKILN